VEGVAKVGATLTAKVTPSGATVNYQWMRCDTADGTYTNITGATSSTYKLVADDAGKYIKVSATGTGSYTGTKVSEAVGSISLVINTTQGKGYDTIQAAINEAAENDTIEVSAGTYAEALSIGKSLTILGVNADNDARTSAFFDEGSIVTGGIEITAGDVTIKGLTIETKGILASNITGLTVVNNRIEEIGEAMEGSPAGSIIGLDVKTEATGPIVIEQNRFSGIGEENGTGTAIRIVRAKDSITITDNIIEDVTKNGINIYSNCLTNANAELTITGNEITNWDSDKDSNDIGGRAIRIDFVGADGSATANITENKLTPPTYDSGETPVDSEYVKLTSVGIEVDLTNNYWGSATPDFETILSVAGEEASDCAYMPYYTDEDMTTLASSPVINTTQNKGYDTIQAAINEAAENDTIEVSAGTYAEALSIGKSLTILGVNADNDARTSAFFDEGSIVTGGIEITAGDVTIKGLTIETKGILASNITGLTVVNNRIEEIGEAMEGSPAGSIIGLDVKTEATGPIVIEQNRFSGIGEENGTGTAIRIVRAKDSITITDNIIEDVTKNGINIYSNCLTNANAELTITGNEITNWDSDKDSNDIGGRAIRIDFVGADGSATANITENKLTPPTYDSGETPVDSEYVKLTSVGIEVDLTNNYWGSATPDFETILSVAGEEASDCAYMPYYTDEDMDTPSEQESQAQMLIANFAEEEIVEFDITPIEDAIQEAIAAKEGIAVSEDGLDVPAGAYWVTQADIEALDAAIATAEAAKGAVETQQDVAEAVEALEAAVSTFNDAKQEVIDEEEIGAPEEGEEPVQDEEPVQGEEPADDEESVEGEEPEEDEKSVEDEEAVEGEEQEE
jgi:hypothetical protein